MRAAVAKADEKTAAGGHLKLFEVKRETNAIFLEMTTAEIDATEIAEENGQEKHRIAIVVSSLEIPNDLITVSSY